jgi:hypothetical protein
VPMLLVSLDCLHPVSMLLVSLDCLRPVSMLLVSLDCIQLFCYLFSVKPKL